MNFVRYITLIICSASGILGNVDLPQRVLQYRPGDWISYSMFRYVTSAVLGQEYVYFGTTGGVLRYQFFENKWEHPFTVSDGLENDYIRDLIYDFNTGFLWCLTDAGVSFRDPSSEYWRTNTGLSRFGRLKDIGAGRNYIWVTDGKEYIPLDPLSGYEQSSVAGDMPPDNVRWKDESAEGLDNSYFMDPQYMFVQGGIQDSEFRTYPITVNTGSVSFSMAGYMGNGHRYGRQDESNPEILSKRPVFPGCGGDGMGPGRNVDGRSAR